MLTLHLLNDSRAQRILWLLEELGLPYALVKHTRDPATLAAPPELKAVHPLGRSPVLVDTPDGGPDGAQPDGEARVLIESGAIVEHLLDRQPCATDGTLLRPPPGTPEHRRWREMLHVAEGSAMTPLTLKIVAEHIKKAPMPMIARPIARQIADGVLASVVEPPLAAQLDWLEAQLADRPWLAGAAFSAADLMMSFPIQTAEANGGLGARPRLADWLTRCQARPAWQRALAASGGYDLKVG